MWFRSFEIQFGDTAGTDQLIRQCNGVFVEDLQHRNVDDGTLRIRGRQRDVGSRQRLQRLIVVEQCIQLGKRCHRNGRDSVLFLQLKAALADDAEFHGSVL